MGALASGAAAAMGTGAFSFARAERDISVEVAGDEAAYLSLEETSAYASGTSGGQLELDWNDADDADGDGLNENSSTRFTDVFKIQNQGTDTVRISFHDESGEIGYSSDAATWYYSEDGGWEDNEVNDVNPELGEGDSISIHVIFDLIDNVEDDLPDHLSIVADEV
ncbi:hypothetical protein C483_06525 [Natrialba hulunbeirensis JCM 10989]|uniref:Uncharacterized protein n=2 Tax=Natrialba hulunbeirensis TaxID=123783 RepID=M0A2F9_9EURY|nr:hypothetical protein C483_06525 [Natrialba hulunbeirensis JCM 10989]